MGIKTVVTETKQIIVCDITGEEITESDIVFGQNKITISKKGWEKIPEALRQQPFLQTLLGSLHRMVPVLDKFTTGFWVLSVYRTWSALYNTPATRWKSFQPGFQTEQDVVDDLSNPADYRPEMNHVFKDGEYLYTVRLVTKHELQKTNVLSNEVMPEFIHPQ